MIKYFENIVVKKAELQIKYKRIFAWLLLISTVYTAIKIVLKAYKAFKKYFEKEVQLRNRIEKENKR
jgi:hypothetical protein